MINGPSIYPPAGRILQVPEPPGTAQVRVRSDEITNSGCSVSGSAARAETKFPSRATLTARVQCGRPSSDICLFFLFSPILSKIHVYTRGGQNLIFGSRGRCRDSRHRNNTAQRHGL